MTSVNNEGYEYFTKRNTIQISEETIHAVINDEDSDYLLKNRSTCLFFCFSWCENVESTIFQQERSLIPIEQGTQTEATCLSPTPTKKFGDNAEISINTIEKGTQTVGKCLSPTSTWEFGDNAEKDTNILLKILSSDLGSFYEDKTDPDCVLKVGETKFPVHRSVLSARSTVFAAMFHHDTSESQSGEVDILDVDEDVFDDVLFYIYTGKVRGLSPVTAAPMYIAADKYALIEFRENCMEFLMLNLNVYNVCDATLIAHVHAETKLENEVIQFIEENLEEIMLNDTWIRFLDTHYKIANKLLSSALIACKTKLQTK